MNIWTRNKSDEHIFSDTVLSFYKLPWERQVQIEYWFKFDPLKPNIFPPGLDIVVLAPFSDLNCYVYYFRWQAYK